MAKKDDGFYHPETGELLRGITSSLLSLDGRLEYPDPVPKEAPVNLRAPSGMRELVQQMIREEMSQLAEAHGMESFEDSEDFDVEDDPENPLTEWEQEFDPALVDAKIKALTEIRDRRRGVPVKTGGKDGGSSVDEGRVADRDGGVRGVDKVGKGKSSEEQDADDGGGVRKADSSPSRADE